MPKKSAILASIISFLILGNILVIFAQTPTPRSDSGERKVDRLSDFRERLNNDEGERTTTKSTTQRSAAVERIKSVFDKILGRNVVFLSRLDKIGEKIDMRADKLSEMGVDTTSQAAALAACSNMWPEASAAIDDAKNKVAAIDAASADIREAVQASVAAMQEAKEALRDYHQCLVDVTKSLKALKEERVENAQ